MDLRSQESIKSKKFYHFVPRPLRRTIARNLRELQNIRAGANALPDFYIIGTMKSGTTALFMHLEQHPEIAAAKRKEIQYFSTDRDLGPNYFRSFFPPRDALKPCENAVGRQITGEATPDYAYHPAAAPLCYKLTPQAKLIMLMRDPVERAFSHWKQGRRFDFVPGLTTAD